METDKTTEKTEEKEVVDADDVKLKGRFSATMGRRKRAVASVRMYKKGKGVIMVNDIALGEYFSAEYAQLVRLPLKQAGLLKDLNFSIKVHGGGKKGQADAARHGIARALVEMNEELKKPMKAKGWLTRDARKKERKKPGLKKARRAPQWAKR